MHYMVGSTVKVPVNRAPSPAKGPQPLNVGRHVRKSKNRYFEPGVEYTLYNIRPVPETGKFEYTFVDKQGQPLVHVFNSISEAEQIMAQANGEDLPDYGQLYQ